MDIITRKIAFKMSDCGIIYYVIPCPICGLLECNLSVEVSNVDDDYEIIDWTDLDEW